MIFDGVPGEASVGAQLANLRPVPKHPLRFLAAQDRNFVPNFGKPDEIWQNLRAAERIGQTIVGNVADPRAAPFAARTRHCFSIAPFRWAPAHMANRRAW